MRAVNSRVHATVALGVALALTVLALPTAAQGPGIVDRYRWASQEGQTTVDSLAYKVKGKRVIGNTAPDTLVAATADTTAAYRVDGAEAITVTAWNTKVVAGSICTYTVQVSNDRTHWSSLTTTFSLAESSSLASSPTQQVLYDRTFSDSTASGFGTSADRRKLSAASWLRVICSNAYHSGTDTTIHSGLIKVRWPK